MPAFFAFCPMYQKNTRKDKTFVIFKETLIHSGKIQTKSMDASLSRPVPSLSLKKGAGNTKQPLSFFVWLSASLFCRGLASSGLPPPAKKASNDAKRKNQRFPYEDCSRSINWFRAAAWLARFSTAWAAECMAEEVSPEMRLTSSRAWLISLLTEDCCSEAVAME